MALSAHRFETAVGLALAGLGVALAVAASQMPKGTVALPGPGFVPLAIGVLLTFAGLGCAGRALAASTPETVGLGGLRVWGTLATLVGVGFAFEPLGAPITLALAVTLFVRLLGDYSIARSAMIGVIASAAAWLVFARLLGIGLPAGLLPL